MLCDCPVKTYDGNQTSKKTAPTFAESPYNGSNIAGIGELAPIIKKRQQKC
jgi:hypothetical protein